MPYICYYLNDESNKLYHKIGNIEKSFFFDLFVIKYFCTKTSKMKWIRQILRN